MALSEWFRNEEMRQYVEFSNRHHNINAMANSIMLFYDMHKALDHYYWAVVPMGRDSACVGSAVH
jgi:hypothetical protein